MSLLKRKLPVRSNTNVLTMSSSSSEEDIISLCPHEEEEEESCNPFVEGEKRLVVLSKQLTKTFVCTTLIAIVWAVLSGISIGIHIEYRVRCSVSDAFGLFGICLLIFMTIRYTTSTVLIGVAVYRSSKINKSSRFQKLFEEYQSMLEKVNFGSVTKRKSTSATKATIEMGRKIDMFNYIRMLMATSRSPYTDVPLFNAMLSLKDCRLLNEDFYKQTHGRKEDHNDNMLLLYVMAAIDAVPLLSLIFFFFIGTETQLPQTESTICVVSLAFNWTLVGIFTLFCIVCCAPLFFRILQRY